MCMLMPHIAAASIAASRPLRVSDLAARLRKDVDRTFLVIFVVVKPAYTEG